MGEERQIFPPEDKICCRVNHKNRTNFRAGPSFREASHGCRIGFQHHPSEGWPQCTHQHEMGQDLHHAVGERAGLDQLGSTQCFPLPPIQQRWFDAQLAWLPRQGQLHCVSTSKHNQAIPERRLRVGHQSNDQSPPSAKQPRACGGQPKEIGPSEWSVGFTGFCRAVLCGCATDEPWLASLCNHHLSLDALFSHPQDEAFKAMWRLVLDHSVLVGWSGHSRAANSCASQLEHRRRGQAPTGWDKSSPNRGSPIPDGLQPRWGSKFEGLLGPSGSCQAQVFGLPGYHWPLLDQVWAWPKFPCKIIEPYKAYDHDILCDGIWMLLLSYCFQEPAKPLRQSVLQIHNDWWRGPVQCDLFAKWPNWQQLLECLSGIHKTSALLKCFFFGRHGQASWYGAMVEEPMVFLEHVPAT